MARPRWTAFVVGLALLVTSTPASLGTAPQPDPGSPSAALTALAATHGVEPDPATAEQVRALDELPDPAAGALADVFTAYEALLTAEEDIEAHQQALTEAARELAEVWREQAPASPLEEPIEIGSFAVVDVAGNDDRYPDGENRWLVVDVGGNDTYRNNAGGASLNHAAVAALVDLAGDDGYGTEWTGPGYGDNGGAVDAVGFLYDAEGDDEYRGGATLGSNGAGYFGHGRLVDDGGDDLYQSARTWCPFSCVNGGAWFGSGLLWDGGGTDTYRTDGYYYGSGGESQDETIVPKGTVGAQIDREGSTVP